MTAYAPPVPAELLTPYVRAAVPPGYKGRDEACSRLARASGLSVRKVGAINAGAATFDIDLYTVDRLLHALGALDAWRHDREVAELYEADLGPLDDDAPIIEVAA
jgi:hypothetical protein